MVGKFFCYLTIPEYKTRILCIYETIMTVFRKPGYFSAPPSDATPDTRRPQNKARGARHGRGEGAASGAVRGPGQQRRALRAPRAAKQRGQAASTFKQNIQSSEPSRDAESLKCASVQSRSFLLKVQNVPEMDKGVHPKVLEIQSSQYFPGKCAGFKPVMHLNDLAKMNLPKMTDLPHWTVGLRL